MFATIPFHTRILRDRYNLATARLVHSINMVRLLRLLLTLGLSAVAFGASNCTAANAVVRKEYGDLKTHEKLQYVRAVKCVLAKPSLLHSFIPASTNKFDDYAAVHINMTTHIHISGIFFAWHRHFIWLMENDLHECGWPASLGIPYWDWDRYSNLETSPSK